jgi:hypothetical protein
MLHIIFYFFAVLSLTIKAMSTHLGGELFSKMLVSLYNANICPSVTPDCDGGSSAVGIATDHGVQSQPNYVVVAAARAAQWDLMPRYMITIHSQMHRTSSSIRLNVDAVFLHDVDTDIVRRGLGLEIFE